MTAEMGMDPSSCAIATYTANNVATWECMAAGGASEPRLGDSCLSNGLARAATRSSSGIVPLQFQAVEQGKQLVARAPVEHGIARLKSWRIFRRSRAARIE